MMRMRAMRTTRHKFRPSILANADSSLSSSSFRICAPATECSAPDRANSSASSCTDNSRHSVNSSTVVPLRIPGSICKRAGLILENACFVDGEGDSLTSAVSKSPLSIDTI